MRILRPSRRLEKRRRRNRILEKRDKKDKNKVATPATGNNTINTIDSQKKKKTGNQTLGDLCNITCYNYNKKNDYANACPKHLKN